MTTIQCMRCGQHTSTFDEKPYPGILGDMIFEKTCPSCWDAWKKFSVNVINDYRLRPYLPQDRAVVEKHMKQFLNLEGQGIPLQTLSGQGQNVSFSSQTGQQTVGEISPASPSKPTSSSSGLQESVIEMLQKIFDPEVPVNIYDLGLIYGVEVTNEGQAHIKMTLTSQHCPAAKSLPENVREAVSRIPGIQEVRVELVWDPPWTKERITEEGREILK